MAEGAEIAKAYVQLVPSFRGVQGAIERELGGEAGGRAGRSFGSGFGTSLLNGIGKAFALGAGAALGGVIALGKGAIETGMSFESSMSQVAATLGLTMYDIENNVNGAGDTFAALQEAAATMGRETIFSATEAAEGLNILAMSGFDAQQAIAMLPDVLHLAAAGNMDMASAAAYVSGSMKGFNNASKGSATYANLIAKGATLANTSVAQLGEAMSDGAATAASYHQSVESTTIALLRLAEQGVVGSAAGTALAAAMKNIYTPTDQARAAMEELGVSAYDASGRERDFNEVVDDLNASLTAVGEDGLPLYTSEQQAAYRQTIFGIQGLDAYNKMVVTGTEKESAWALALADANEGMGEAAQQYETMTHNFEGATKAMASAFEGLKNAIYEDLKGPLTELANFAAGALGHITEAYEENGIEGAFDAFGKELGNGVEMLTEFMPVIAQAAISLLGAFGKSMIENAPMLLSTILEMLQHIRDWIAEPGNISGIIDGGVQLVIDLAEGIADAAELLIPAITQGVIEIAKAMTNPDNVTRLTRASFDIVMALVRGIFEALPMLLRSAPEIIDNLARSIVELGPVTLECGSELLKALGKGIEDTLPALEEAVIGIGKVIGEDFLELINTAQKWGRDLLINFGAGISQAADDLWTTVSGVASDIASLLGFSEPETGPLSNFHTYAPDMMTLFTEGVEAGKAALVDTVSGVAEAVRETMASAGQETFAYSTDYTLRTADAWIAQPKNDDRSENENRVAELLERIAELAETGQKIVLEDGTIVGVIDRKLGERARRREREA